MSISSTPFNQTPEYEEMQKILCALTFVINEPFDDADLFCSTLSHFAIAIERLARRIESRLSCNDSARVMRGCYQPGEKAGKS